MKNMKKLLNIDEEVFLVQEVIDRLLGSEYVETKTLILFPPIPKHVIRKLLHLNSYRVKY